LAAAYAGNPLDECHSRKALFSNRMCGRPPDFIDSGPDGSFNLDKPLLCATYDAGIYHFRPANISRVVVFRQYSAARDTTVVAKSSLEYLIKDFDTDENNHRMDRH
jgi:hypothetical protein